MNFKNHSQLIISLFILFISFFSINAGSGDLDLTFGNGGKVFTNISDGAFGDCQVNDMALQPDGKIIGVGYYRKETLGKTDTAVIRLNTDGSLDTSFGNNGKVITSFFDENDAARSVALQPDGKIVVVGYAYHEYNNSHSYFTVLRYNPDGSLDNTFNGNGKVLTDFNSISVIATAVAIQPDGQIIATGTNNNSRIIAARYNSDGSLDQSFGTAGKVSYTLGTNLANYSEAMVLQTDGKIVIAGSVKATPNSSNRYFTVSRLNSDGSIDINFGAGGWASTTFNSNPQNYATSITVQPDGKIIAAGATSNNQGLASDFALARFNPNGTLDTSFNGDGKVTTNVETSSLGANSSDIIFDVIFKQNKITVSGYSNLSSLRRLSLVRYNLDGSLDTTFDMDGKIRVNLPGEFSPNASLLIQNDGKIIGAGRKGSLSSPGNMIFVRLLEDGTIDQTFDTNGIAQVYLGKSRDEVKTLLIQPDGKIVLAGNSDIWIVNCLSLVRYHINGSIDTSFASNGRSQICFDIDGQDGNKDLATVHKFLRQPDGKFLLAGRFSRRIDGFYSTNFLLMRFNEDGLLDKNFGENGKVTTDFENSEEEIAYSAALQADGKIVLAGKTEVNSNYDTFAVVRYNSDGTLDTTFDGDGKLFVVFAPNQDQEVKDVVIQPDNKIILAGTVAGNDIGLVRLNTDGSLDVNFGTEGKTRIDIKDYSSDQTKAVKLQDDGKIIVLAVTTSPSVDFALARVNSNGSLDTSFGMEGKVITDLGHADFPSDLAIQPDGKIVVVGQTYSNNSNNFATVRYSNNGTLDNNFGVNGSLITDLSVNKFDSATSVAIQSNGYILVGGHADLDGLPSERDFALIRYKGDSTTGFKTPFDFDGDSKTDISVFRPSTQAWYLLQSQSGFSGIPFGNSTDKLVPADYDGDGKTDIAVFRDGNWYRLNSSNGEFNAVTFGANEDLPRPGDYDGDGKADIAVFRPSNGTWYWLNSSNGQFNGIQFGMSGDIPLIADFDGDGKTDISVFRPSNGHWYWLNSSNGQFSALHFGIEEDIPAIGDFDGDGKTDISVFRPSTGGWYRINSGDQQFAGVAFGMNGDIPAVGDYDGDGKSDITVYRPGNGHWYLLNSQSGFAAVQFGAEEDKPIPSVFR